MQKEEEEDAELAELLFSHPELVRTSQFLCAWWLLCTFAGKFAGDAARRTGINMYQHVSTGCWIGSTKLTSIDIT